MPAGFFVCELYSFVYPTLRFSAQVNGFKMVGVAAEGEAGQPCLVSSKNLLRGL